MRDWRPLLDRCSKALLSSRQLPIQRRYDVSKITYFGFPPATEEQICEAERRLGADLPASLRAFYGMSNGWRIVGDSIYAVPSIHELMWLRDFDAHLFGLADQISTTCPEFVDDPNGTRRAEHCYEQGVAVARSLAVSCDGDASIWLLDPGELDLSGEWRAGRWSSWNPGMSWIATSFYELFEDEVVFLEQFNEEG